MSRPRGNSHQRRLAAIARETFEAVGWSCRLDFAQRGAVQHVVVVLPGGAEKRIPVHGTPRSEGSSERKFAAKCRRIIRENENG